MKLRVTKSNLYHNGKRCSVGDVITIKGDSVPKLYMGKVEAINEQGLTTDKEAGSDLTALQAENDDLREENADLKARNEALETENADLKASVTATVENRPDDADPGTQVDAQKQPTQDTSAEADAKRKAWLIDEIEKLTGERPGSNSKLETLEAKFEKAKLEEK
ncbi:hypothetical protein P3W43_01445 [Salinicola salarius]|uniref:hypothetical protein n=1 Tax=Salinicola salarius TaxID=430457 RepID=UPI0023E3722E|nr:hypothetical protein [Salinicola salarius]MDF3917513.1 hypothetical protein [Salinicola salarius]